VTETDKRRPAPHDRGNTAEEPQRIGQDRENAPAFRNAKARSIVAEARLRDQRAVGRDLEATRRDLEAEHVAMTFGVDYNIDDAKPFHARRQAETDRAAAHADRQAAEADRAALSEIATEAEGDS
jgi:hypothetical protein